MRRLAVAAVLLAVVACKKADSTKPSGSPPGGTAPAGGDRGAIKGGVEGAGPATPSGPDDQYQVEAVAVAGAPGAETVARVVVRPGKGFHMNKDYPTKLSLELPAGVTAAKPVLEPADAEAFDDNQLAFAVKLTAASAGDYSIPGMLKFAVCTESTCNPKKHAIALALTAH
jgi:hypothetical protein